MSNIERIDSATNSRWENLLNGVVWNVHFRHALDTWPCINDLGANAAAGPGAKCGACEAPTQTLSMVQMFGQPYDPTSLKTVPPSESAQMNRVS